MYFLLPLIELTTTEETFLHTPLYAIHEILQITESVILNPEQMEDPILISERIEINSLNWIPVTLAFIYTSGGFGDTDLVVFVHLSFDSVDSYVREKTVWKPMGARPRSTFV